MSTSLSGGRVRFNPNLYDNSEAFDTAMARCVINNALHFADEAAQVRVCFPPMDPTKGFDGTTSASTDKYLAKFGPFPMHIKSDRTPFTLRVRMHGKVNAGTATFKCVIHPSSMDGVDATTTANTVSASTSSTSAIWLTNTTDNIAVLTPLDVLTAFKRLDTIASVGGNVASVHWPLFSASVYAEATSGTPTATLSGLYVAEYVGT